VARGHDEMRELGLGSRLIRERGIFARDAVGPECPQQIELRAARAFRAMVGEIDDVALERPVDRAVRRRMVAVRSLWLAQPGLSGSA